MLYTDKGNRFVFWVLIPIMVTTYFAFRVFDWQKLDDGNRALIGEEHSKNILLNPNINCLVLGGSNSIFGLSAEQLSDELNLNCYNLSLLNEGNSDSAYWHFIENLSLSNISISHVFYSSISPISTQINFNARMADERRGIGIVQDNSFKLSGRSIASYLKLWLEGEAIYDFPQYQLPNTHGDFIFELYERCNKETVQPWFLPVRDLDALNNWGRSQIENMNFLFPNAQLYLVLPSTLRSEFFKESDFLLVVNTLRAIASETSTVTQKVIFLEQSPFINSSVLCDGEHHPNAQGREIRTRELIQIYRNLN